MSIADVPWSSLSHAYGPATDIPPILEALRSPDPAKRAHALELLDTGPFHQGTYYTCLPAMVPFLVELVEAGDPHVERAALLRYLARITPVRSRFFSPCLADIPPILHELVPQEIERNAPIAMDVLAASGRALPTYLRLLGDADPEVRAAAAAVAARLEDARDQVLPALRRLHHAETESAVRAVTAYLLGACAADEDRASIQSLATLGEPLLVRAAAALGLVDGRPQSVGPMIAAGIRELLSCDEDVIDALQALWDGTIACLTRRERLLSVLDELPRAEAALVFPGLLARMERSWIGWLHVFDVARRIAFGDREIAPGARVTDLDALQRALLESLARALATHRETSVPGVAGLELETVEELRAFLDGRRPAVLGSAP